MSAPSPSPLDGATGGAEPSADSSSSHVAAPPANADIVVALAAPAGENISQRRSTSLLGAPSPRSPSAALHRSISSTGLPCPPCATTATTANQSCLGSPITPATIAATTARPAVQQSLSVLVRLKGTTTKLGSAPPPPPLLSYTLDDGTLTTPQRTARRAASLGSGTDPATTGSAEAAAAASFAPPTAPRSACPPSPLTTLTSPLLTSVPASDLAAGTAAAAAVGATASRGGGSGTAGSSGRVLTIGLPSAEEWRQYELGEVLEPNTTNTALCERLVPSVMEQLAAGYSVCVLCYGQTGSGKTYTMDALAPAVAERIFRGLDANNEVVEMSYVQVYKDKAYSLLDRGRATGSFGAELSRPPAGAATGGTSGGSGSPNNCTHNSGRASEPKVLLHSAREVEARMRAAARLRATEAHTLNSHSSLSSTLLSLHITRFLDGAPLTTTRVTLVDPAGAERSEKSGATGEAVGQVTHVNDSLAALRQLVESNGTEADVPHRPGSLLTTYLAPRIHSCHLILLVTVSLEVGSYEATTASLDFAASAPRRCARKVKCRTAESLSGAAQRGEARPSLLASAGTANGLNSHHSSDSFSAGGDCCEVRSVVDALQYRVRMLEKTLWVQQQRSALAATAPASPLSDGLASGTHNGSIPIGADTRPAASPTGAFPSSPHAAAGSDPLDVLRREVLFYRRLLREREEDLRRVHSHLAPAPPSSLTEPPSLQPETGDVRETMAVGTAAASSEQSSGGSSDAEPRDADGDGTFAQLRRGVRALRPKFKAPADGGGGGGGDGGPMDELWDTVLCATELYDDARERLLVTSTSLAGLRAQNHQLYDRLLEAQRQLLAQDEHRGGQRVALQAATARAAAAEAGVEELRLRLYQAYAEQAVREETTRLYLDATRSSATDAEETVSSRQHPEHQAELEKVQAQHQALCDKITELVDNVDQLTRAVAQRDVSLTALESLITPAQRALFHSMSTTCASSPSAGATAGAAAAAAAAAVHANGCGGADFASCLTDAAEDGGSVADCVSLLQSRVSELAAMLSQEQQHHKLTQRELAEAREDARRSRQKQRQETLQQQEEARRVAQLTTENFELRQQNERHQLYLDQLVVNVQEQLAQLRHQHEAELAAVHPSSADVRPGTRHARRPTGAPVATPRGEPLSNPYNDYDRYAGGDDEDDDTATSLTARASARRSTTQGVPPAGAWPRGDTARGQNGFPTAADAAGVGGGSERGLTRTTHVQRRSVRAPRGSGTGVEEAGAGLVATTVHLSRRGGHTANGLPPHTSLFSKPNLPLSAIDGDRHSEAETGLTEADMLVQLAATSPSLVPRRRGKSTGPAAARRVKQR